MKKLLLVLFVLSGVLTLAACSEPVNEGEVIDFSDTFVEKSRIRVWIDDENGEYMEEVIEEFNKVHPDIVVEHQHMGSVDARELLKTFGPSGNGADVFQFPHDHLAQAIREDLVLPLPNSTRDLLEGRAHELGMSIATVSYDEGAEENPFDPDSPNAVERLYAVPMSVESIGLYYNKDLVPEPAETFEELLAAADDWNEMDAADDSEQTNAEKGWYYLGTSSHWADSYFMQPIYSAFDFYPFGPNLDDPSAVGFEDAVPALEWMDSELRPRTTGNGSHDSIGGGTLFEEGKIPYVIGGPWNHEAYKDAGLNYGVAQMPSIEVDGEDMPTRTFAGAMMAAVYKYSDNTEDAIKFVEFLNSDIAMELQYEMKGKFPALTPEYANAIPGVADDELLLGMSEQLETSVPMPTIPQVTHYWGPGESMIIDVWNNDVEPSEAAAEAEDSYEALAGLSG
ncbi:MAG: maltose ABC transporter substrate-binding protein [Acholeplasmataceae bacterium]